MAFPARLPHILVAIGILGAPILHEFPVARATSIADEIGPSPVGYREFCREHIDLCFIDTLALAPITAADMALARQINREVNASIAYQAMPDRDPWDISPAAGDCDDFAATKLALLVEAGLPRQNLRFAIVLTETAQPHLVLLLKAGDQDLVLDNRRSEVLAADQTLYRFISEEMLWGDHFGTWLAVDGVAE
jgi:predicted transglutaminase-like cysteine proteinase